ncbi:MAG: hypothetical protein NVSMB4_19990 [Acidimicrobiales bacterium]
MRNTKERLAHLRAVPMFQVCTDKELLLIAKLGEELPVKTGEAVVAEGTIGHEFYVLVSGKAEVTRTGRCVATLGPGDYFGELALLDPQPRTATVSMLSDGEVIEVSQREFWQLLTDVPALSRKLLQGMARRMHDVELATS